jgi:hypothetical protein
VRAYLVPTLDHAALTQGEGDGLPTLHTVVKLSAINQLANVVDPHCTGQRGKGSCVWCVHP